MSDRRRFLRCAIRGVLSVRRGERHATSQLWQCSILTGDTCEMALRQRVRSCISPCNKP
jgi:hypothetical protein